MTDSEKTVRALFCAFNRLTAARGTVDAWDFFPEADFDTGSNLCRTLRAGVEAVKRDESLGVCDLLDRAARAMLRAARGRSGAILAAAFKGFSDETAKCGGVTAAGLPAALHGACARAAVLLAQPVGKSTMADLLAHCAAALTAAPQPTLAGAFCFLDNTAKGYLHQNAPPDAGALGLSLLLEGVAAYLSDADAALPGAVTFQKQAAADGYLYAVALTVLARVPFCAPALRGRLQEVGEAVRVEERGDTLAVSLCTNRPDSALTQALRFGSLTEISIKNRAQSAAQNAISDGGSPFERL